MGAMTFKRTPLWDADKHDRYWEAKDEASQRAKARLDGEHTAERLDEIWAGLEAEEQALMEFLLLRDRRSVVALYDDDLFNSLVSKGLLQIPPGVGTLLMQELETSFAVPRAVWRDLTRRRGEFLPYSESRASERLQEATAIVAPKVRL